MSTVTISIILWLLIGAGFISISLFGLNSIKEEHGRVTRDIVLWVAWGIIVILLYYTNIIRDFVLVINNSYYQPHNINSEPSIAITILTIVVGGGLLTGAIEGLDKMKDEYGVGKQISTAIFGWTVLVLFVSSAIHC